MSHEPPARSLGVTMSDIADAAGVSRVTVSRALHGTGRIAPATRERIGEIAAQLGYVPNVMATQLAAGSTRTIGLLLRDAANPAYGLLFTRLQDAAREKDIALVSMTITVDDHGRRQISGLRHLLGMRVAGLIAATGGVTSEQLVPFSGEVPIMRAGRPEESPQIHAVSYDEEANATLLADHVAALGHRRVAVLVTTADSSFPEFVRGTAMLRRLRDHGVGVERIDVSTAGTGVERAVDLGESGRVSAVMCPSDFRQLDVIRLARSRGLAVPDDLSVTGCDGVLPGIDLLGLTTVRLPVERLAERVVHHMSSLIDGGSQAAVVHERLPGTLLPGATVGRWQP